MWIKDPFTKQLSVSLTLLVASYILVVAAGILEMFELVKSTSIFSELYYAATALYFSRRFQFGSKTFSSEPAEKLTEQLKEIK